MVASAYLIPGRRFTFATLDIPTAAYSWSAGWLGTDRRSSLTVTWGIVSTSCRRKSICDPCIRPAIMMVKPTPIATPNMPTRVCRTRVLTWVHAMLSRRFVVMRLPGRAVFADVPACIVNDGIDVGRYCRGYHGVIGIDRTGHDAGRVPIEGSTGSGSGSGSGIRGGIHGRLWCRFCRHIHICYADPRTVGQIRARR